MVVITKNTLSGVGLPCVRGGVTLCGFTLCRARERDRRKWTKRAGEDQCTEIEQITYEAM